MRLPSSGIRPPGRSGIRPPGGRSSIRPPRAMAAGTPARPARTGAPGQGAPAGPRPPGGPGGAGRRTWLLGTTATLVVLALVAVGAWLPRLARTLATGAGDQPPAAAEAGTEGEERACSTRAALDTPADARGWEEAWRLDSGTASWEETPWYTYSAGTCLVIASPRSYSGHAVLTGYRLTESGPERLWTQSGDDPDSEVDRLSFAEDHVWWGERLIAGNMLLDPATGTLSEAPWVPQASSAAAVTSELALACRTSATTGDPVTCSAWDWNNGSPERRWRHAYDVGTMSLARALGMSGSADDGSVVVETQPAGTGTSEPGDTESTDEPGTSTAVQLLSLADGSLHGSPSAERVSSDTESGTSYIPARDGWIRIDSSGTGATVVSSGNEDGQIFPVQDIPTVLLVDGDAPTVSQLRAAYETGDTSWADTVLRCEDASTCTLNGSPVDIPEESLNEQRLHKGGYQALATLSTDGRTLVVPSSPFWAKQILLIDTESGQVSAPAQETAQQEAQHVVYTARATEDLVLLVLDTRVVAYSPTG